MPNRAARSLVTRRSDSIGVVIAEPAGLLFSDPFFPRLLRGISAALSARDLQLVLLMPSSPAETHRTADYLAAGHVDGALLVSLHDDDPLPLADGRGAHPDGRLAAAAPADVGQLRRRRQPWRRAQRGRPPHRPRPTRSSRPSPVRPTWPRASTGSPATATRSSTPASGRTPHSRSSATSPRPAAHPRWNGYSPPARTSTPSSPPRTSWPQGR